MSKIGTSQRAFENADALGKRQPAGAMSKRQAAGVMLAAERPLSNPFELGGIVGASARRGYENVFDNIIERHTIYCLNCGSANEKTAEKCKLCFTSCFSPDKFEISCLSCEKPFHTLAKRPTHPKDSKAAFPLRSAGFTTKIINGQKVKVARNSDKIAIGEYDARLIEFLELTCHCFDDIKAARRRELSIKKVVIVTKDKVIKRAASARQDAQKRLDYILSLNKGGLSREQKQILSREKVRLLKIVCPVS